MKQGWELKSLVDICERMFAGGDVPKNNFSKFETDKYKIPIFANGVKDKGLYGYTDIEKVIKPSITISARGTIGYSEIRNKPFFPIVRLIVLTPDIKIISLEFLQYTIQSIDFKMSGTSIPQLTIPNVKKYQLNVPSINEQKKIVNIIDEAFESIEKAKVNIEKNLQNSKELFDSRLNEIFSQKGDSWEEKIINDVCEKIFAGGDVPKDNFSDIKTEKYQVPIFANGISNKGLYGYTNIQKVTTPSITVSARGTIGYSEIRNEPFFPIVRLVVLSPNIEIINLEFLQYIIKGINFKNTGTSIPQLTVPMVKLYKISFPLSLCEQKEIVKELDIVSKQIKQLETKYQQKLNNLEELKKSILQKAFSGELTS